MSATVQPVVITPDLDRSLQFYTALFGAVEHLRIPEDGPTFYVGLTIGNGELGLASEAGVDVTAAPRILISIEVADVDGLLDQVEPAGGKLLGPPTDMPWGQRVAHIQDPDGNPLNLTQPLQP